MANQLLIAAFMVFASMAIGAFALEAEMINVLSYKANIRVNPFPKMTQTTYHVIDGATVNIETNFVSGKDQLLVDYQGKFNIRGTFDDDLGILLLEGTAPISEYAAAFASVVFLTTAEDGLERKITSTFGKNTIFLSTTNHFYEIISRTNPPWNEAKVACDNKQYMETFQGYLATIGSQDALNGIGSKIKTAYWIGANRSSTTDTWQWATGPDAGEPFWRGGSIYTNGAPFPDTYAFSSWKRFQPNYGGNNLIINVSDALGTADFDDANDLSNVMGYICEYGGLESEDVASQYQWYTDITILRFDCSLLESNAECTNRKSLGCTWRGATCYNSQCSGIATQRDCVSNWQCAWNTEGNQGVCVSTTCSQYATSATCSHPNCDFKINGGAAQCRDAKCYQLTLSSECSQRSACNWRGTYDKAGAGRCFYDASIDCNGTDVVYLLDGTVTMSEEYGKYTSGFFGLSQILKEADFALTGNLANQAVENARFGSRVGFIQYGGTNAITISAGLPGTGGQLTGDITQAINDLTWQQSAYTASVTTRNAKPGLQKAIGMLQNTNPYRRKIIVLIAAGSIDDVQTLQSDPVLATIRSSGIQFLGVSLRSSFPDTPSSTAAVDSLTALGAKVLDITLGEFADRVIYGLCSMTAGTAGGLLPSSQQGADCEDYLTYDTCNSRSLCQWDNSDRKCGQAQCLTLSAVVCNNNPACTYDTTHQRCFRKCPTYTQATCPTTGCAWAAAGYCDSAACVANIKEDECVAETGCFYTVSSTGGTCAPKRCLATDSVTCVAETGCAYKNGYCFIDTCVGFGQLACAQKPQCAYDAKNSVCRPNECAYYQGEAACAADTACLWSVDQSPAMCIAAPCSYLVKNATNTYEASCKLYPQCYWQPQSENGLADICIPKICESMKRSCDCMAMSGCVWRDNQCKNSVFTQCTASDAIFLIESTKGMDSSFSRHPSGAQGIISSIRTWAKAAPIAPDSQSTGFRLGLLGYGSAGSALFPTQSPCSSGSTSPLCTSVADFVGPNSAINSFLNSFASYTNGVGSDVAIKKGLEAALALFRNNMDPANPRKQILVVIGNQPITDGNAYLNQTVTDLENLGVKIFSVVVQRFDLLSAVETTAAQFLGPVASDPTDNYFMYSTIDNFYSGILDNFCDPSTTTGVALEVSRNGILPCDWLTGATECNIESSCVYNATGYKTCALPGQCPNLGCVALPAYLVSQGFSCVNCRLINGAFQCTAGTSNPVPLGVCQKAPCSIAGCSNTTCSGSCFWGKSNICLRSMCTATDITTCNADQGCVWTDPNYASISSGNRVAGCTFSTCGTVRDELSCDAEVITGDASSPKCNFDDSQSPAICVERRCVYLDAANCLLRPVQCEWSSIATRCTERMCQYTTNEACEMDPTCYWDPFTVPVGTDQRGTCKVSTGNCELSPSDGEWSAWSSNCGENAIRTRSRTILNFPSATGATCIQAASAGTAMFEVQTRSQVPSNTPGLPEASCADYCGRKTNPDDCSDDAACQWLSGSCSPVTISNCVLLGQTDCDTSDMCAWDSTYNYCRSGITVCQQAIGSTCSGQTSCIWRTGGTEMTWGQTIDAPVQLVNPNEDEIFPFVTLQGIDERVISGASVTIEENYQRGKDLLDIAYPIDENITYSWNPATATLTFTGNSTITEYLHAIRFVTFTTSSQRSSVRTITYALGSGMFYSSATGHIYNYVKSSVIWEQARALCSNSKYFGYNGYLATIASDEENSLIAAKMNAEGWISGDDFTNGIWKYSTGPNINQAFWTGGSPINGGYAAPGQYANWDTVSNEPRSVSTSYSHPYLNKTGYWSTHVETYAASAGYICEYMGMISDIPTNLTKLGDVSIIGIGGCLPAEPCGYHTTQAACGADFECLWRGNKCVSGCSILATSSECAASPGSACVWDTNVIPAVCDVNPCTGLNQQTCTGTTRCSWGSSGCSLKTGCAQFIDAGSCSQYDSCIWSVTSSGGQCDTRSCTSITTQNGCSKNPTCEWNVVLGCLTLLCKYGTSALCSADNRCTWNQPDPSVAGFLSGGEKVAVFSSGSQPPTDFQTSIDGIVVSIIEGFQSGSDVLAIDPADSTGTFTSNYYPTTGVLLIRIAAGSVSNPYDAFYFIRNNLKFYTSSGASTKRIVSYTIAGKTAYSTITQSYLRMANGTANTRQQAEAVCSNSRFMGLQGSLATITSQADNARLASVGAYGWIAANNIGSNQWQWDGANSPFWSGAASLGAPTSATAFAQWAIGEPSAGKSSAFMTETGTWKAVDSVTVAIPVLCAYGGVSTPDLQLFGSRAVKPIGCFATPCIGLARAQCALSSGCTWNVDTCQLDSFCSVATNSTICNNRERCYWDFGLGTCRTSPDNACSRLTNSLVCGDYAQCTWNSNIIPRAAMARNGACTLSGCAVHPASSACTADPLCRWAQPIGQTDGQCTNRLCGYLDTDKCWLDNFCEWNFVTGRCQQSTCYGTSSSACTGGCQFNSDSQVCYKPQCGYSSSMTTCHMDPACLWVPSSSTCTKPGCAALATDTQCTANSNCYFTYKPVRCAAAQCIANTAQPACEKVVGGMAQCRWTGTACRELTWLERNAPAATSSCEKEVEPNLWWLWLLLAIIIIIIALIIWRLYLAYSKGLNFFEPQRRNVKYSPHEQYAADLFEDAQIEGEETNNPSGTGGNKRPSLNDL